jgi:hypothetical protein
MRGAAVTENEKVLYHGVMVLISPAWHRNEVSESYLDVGGVE